MRNETRSPAVLFLHHSSSLGGTEKMLLLALSELAARGYRPLVACTSAGGPLPEAARASGFAVAPLDFLYMRHRLDPVTLVRYLGSVRSVGRRVLALAREQNVSLLHAYSPVAALYAVRAARRLDVPLVVHFHDAQRPKGPRRLVIRYLARRAAAFVCVSRSAQAMLVGAGVPLELTQVIYNAVDESFLAGSPEPTPQVPRNGPNIGLFAQIVPWKGQHVFLAAAAEVARRIPGVRFYVVGTLVDAAQQPYLERLERLARTPPLRDRVTFAGFQRDVDRWMAAMDVLVHASIEPEAFGLVIAEAMALGKPVVATDVGGPREIVHDGDTGRLVPPNDPAALAGALAEMIEQPDAELGVRAAAAVRQRFSPAAHGAAVARLYEQLLSARAGRRS